MKKNMYSTSISKVLSRNDTGETGSNMAGILIPKDQEILSFFPKLNIREKNPRATIKIIEDDGTCWQWNFIYYNNRFYGGTRNEYRLTGMTEYIRKHGLKMGDTLILSQRKNDEIYVSFKVNSTKASSINNPEVQEKIEGIVGNKKRIKLGDSWKIIKF